MNEWVEVTASSVDAAVAAGMAELSIDNREHVEVEVLQEPEKGFLGIGRQDAVVKIKPRTKPKRKRSRNRRGKEAGDSRRGGGNRSSAGGQGQGGNGRRQGRSGEGRSGEGRSGRDDSGRGGSGRGGSGRGGSGQGGSERSGVGRGRGDGRQANDGGGRGGRKPQRRDDRSPARPKRETEAVAVDTNEQADVIREFLEGLLVAFGLEGSVETRVDDDVIYADIEGEQTEALIGAKATILQAIHELAKTVVQRKTMAGTRLRLDIGGYAERRRQALTIYATRLADQVLDEGAEIMLEPMNPADRKTVHDAVTDIEGVRSFSEGEDPRRSVVLSPD